MAAGGDRELVLGPRTTVFELVAAYPFLASFRVEDECVFPPVKRQRSSRRKARVTTLAAVATRAGVSWRQLAREIAAEIGRVTGASPRLAGVRRLVPGDPRFEELRAIVAGLEAGEPLLELAERWREATAGLDPREAAALDAVFAPEPAAAGSRRLAEAVAASASEAAAVGPGHPLDALRDEAARIRVLSADLEAELAVVRGVPVAARRSAASSRIAALAAELEGIEARFRRLREAWLPTLALHEVQGPDGPVGELQSEALVELWRLRAAAAAGDREATLESGGRSLELLAALRTLEEEVVEPLAARHFGAADWATVRELEDEVGWRLIEPPPAWPAG